MDRTLCLTAQSNRRINQSESKDIHRNSGSSSSIVRSRVLVRVATPSTTIISRRHSKSCLHQIHLGYCNVVGNLFFLWSILPSSNIANAYRSINRNCNFRKVCWSSPRRRLWNIVCSVFSINLLRIILKQTISCLMKNNQCE